MARTADGSFDFTFFALREPMRYYVAAAGLRSQEFAVDVVDLPRITNLKLTYNYPNWTKLEPLVVEPGDDIRAVEGTQVTVELDTDQPLEASELVVDGQRIAMQSRRRRELRDARGREGRRVPRLDAVQRRRRESHGRISDRR